MINTDVAVIGGGILGCFAARSLRRWDISVALIEKESDVCTGITRANSAVVYAGYDTKPGSMKAAMTVSGNRGFDRLCRELDVPFSRCGSLMVAYDERGLSRLRRKLDAGIQNGVPDLRLLSAEEGEELEPMLRPGAVGALYAPTTGTVNPWLLGIAAYENAVNNGARALLSTCVTGIEPTGEGYLLQTEGETIAAKAVINCGGLYSDKVQELCFDKDIRLSWDSAEFLVLDRLAPKPSHIIFQQSSVCGKGITAIPCTEGNLLLSGVRKPLNIPFATTTEGLRELKEEAASMLRGFDEGHIIRSFAAVRPNPYRENGESLHDFCISRPAAGFFSLIGIKTPGLTCADELGRYVADKAAEFLGARPNGDFDPCRKAIPKTDEREIICQCEGVGRSQIVEAIRRGANSVEAVKRRVGSGMGVCQGSRCSYAISRILEESRHGAL